MTGETVLIAAFSGRALAQSARRAGYRPIVVDAFGDQDTCTAAAVSSVVSDAIQSGFKARALIDAIDRALEHALSPPVGVVFGSGFEDKPRLIEAVARRFTLLGSSADTVRRSKDPAAFFSLLDELLIAHPETRIDPPTDVAGWLSKRAGGSGGRHIRAAKPTPQSSHRRYFQRYMAGQRVSVSALVGPENITMGLTRQWSQPTPALPFRYGGAVRLAAEDLPQADEITSQVERLARTLDIRGLASFDFIIADGRPFLLEVNARPGATHDIFDCAAGSLFYGHVNCARGGGAVHPLGTTSDIRAAAILHADRAPITLGKIDWPDWAADRGQPGSHIPLGTPLATVFADAQTSDAAEALAGARLATLESLIYEQAK